MEYSVALVCLPNLSTTHPSLSIAAISANLSSVGRYEFHLRNDARTEKIKALNQGQGIRDMIIRGDFKPESEISDYVRQCVSEIIDRDFVYIELDQKNLNLSLLAAAALKQLKPSILIAFGGMSNSFTESDGKGYLDKGLADYLLFGEPDRLLPKLLASDEKDPIGGVMTRTSIQRYLEWLPEHGIDSFPFPCYRKYDIDLSDARILPIMASRGCSGSCTFCSQWRLWKGLRKRSPRNVADEIKHDIGSYGIRDFKFCDLFWNNDPAFVKDFCNIMIDEVPGVRWGACLKALPFMSEELYRMMYQAGCRLVFFGAETGSDEVRKEMRKAFSTETLVDNLKRAAQAGLRVHLYIIAGYPTETDADFLKTVELLAGNREHIASFSVQPFQQTKDSGIRHPADREKAMKRIALLALVFGNDIFKSCEVDFNTDRERRLTVDEAELTHVRKLLE